MNLGALENGEFKVNNEYRSGYKTAFATRFIG